MYTYLNKQEISSQSERFKMLLSANNLLPIKQSISNVKWLLLHILAGWNVQWPLCLLYCVWLCVYACVCNCQDGGLMTLWICSRGVANEAYVYGVLAPAF